MSDAESLTLPRPGSLTRVRRRRRKPPKNWKRILAWIIWDTIALVLNILLFVSGKTIGLVGAVMFGLDLTLQIRRLGREDGDYRFGGEDKVHVILLVAIWLSLLGYQLSR